MVQGQFAGQADLVHVGSVAGHGPFPNRSVYCATTSAVAHLARDLRAERGPRGVRVRNVEPGVTVMELGADTRDAEMRDADGRADCPSQHSGCVPGAVTFESEAWIQRP
ncbi:SDR family NAD(P)-dependent oxidoreductase [Streptomyces sp. NPDC041068]|uniref:SDR family NAD(P)-dependent oxidoreductase n=1 Tax=Streptomyces sp. NPDC041068 TaxID=3155130 RepID=UPI0033E7DA01